LGKCHGVAVGFTINIMEHHVCTAESTGKELKYQVVSAVKKELNQDEL